MRVSPTSAFAAETFTPRSAEYAPARRSNPSVTDVRLSCPSWLTINS